MSRIRTYLQRGEVDITRRDVTNIAKQMPETTNLQKDINSIKPARESFKNLEPTLIPLSEESSCKQPSKVDFDIISEIKAQIDGLIQHPWKERTYMTNCLFL